MMSAEFRNPSCRPSRGTLRCIALSGLLLLAGCATHPGGRAKPAFPPDASVAPPVREEDRLLALLAGQFALHDGDLAGAAHHFARAARLGADPEVAAQATRLALAVGDHELARASLAHWKEAAPRAPQVAQAEARIALAEGDEQAAFERLAVLAARGDSEAWGLVARALLGAGDATAAARVLARLATAERLGNEESVWLAVSQLAWKLGDRMLAERTARTAIERFHGSDAYAWNAQIALERGDTDAARASYVAALAHDPDDVHLRTSYAALLSDAGDPRGAARFLARGPQDDTTYAARAAYAARADDRDALAGLYRELEADPAPRSGDRRFLLGQVAELSGHIDAAIDWYAQVDDEDEHGHDARVRRIVLLDRQGRTDDALAAVRALAARVATDPERLGNAYLLEAELLASHDRRDEALALHTRALQNLPDDPRILYARALLRVEMQDLAGAEHDLRRIIERDPDNADALNALGYTLADRTDRLDEALALIERAVRLKPDEPAIIDSLGWARYRLGDLDAALGDLRRAFEKQPDPEIAAHLGEVLWVMGRHEEARAVWEKGRKIDADNPALVETIRRLAT